MPAVRCVSRIDTFELKSQIKKKLGSQKAEKYFTLLTKYLSFKLKKTEFDKLCVSLVGREHVRLHNDLIIAIVKNATVSKTPPPKHFKTDGPVTLKAPNGTNSRTSLQSLCRDAFPPSPRKGRTPNLRERKINNRPVSITFNETTTTELVSLGSKPPVAVNSIETGEEVEQGAISPGVHSRTLIRAPIGVNVHTKETRKVVFSSSDSGHYTNTCYYSGYLPATSLLDNRLKNSLKTKGLDISMDCVDVLNNGLDSFLKRVIKPSLELTRSRLSSSISMLDFQVATEINPMIFGDVSQTVHENNI
ncbi:uncharacterized protein [Rutidosis leptorrhynchoides]|uniref:uncharacterized protein n=1 Tax=Rutidosis leptorrhynchoides TaxID=125765 RepID=UPI003A9A6161